MAAADPVTTAPAEAAAAAPAAAPEQVKVATGFSRSASIQIGEGLQGELDDCHERHTGSLTLWKELLGENGKSLKFECLLLNIKRLSLEEEQFFRVYTR